LIPPDGIFLYLFTITDQEMISIADIRKEYKLQTLSEKDILQDPISQFDKWWQEALASGIEEANAMTLATSSSDGIPSARIVLLKGFGSKGFSFFSNYTSFKGLQLLENPRACLVFFWKELERQVRITGLVGKLSKEESDAYFTSRPEGSRIGAWASPQSQLIEGREWLESREKAVREQYQNKPVPRPDFWGGYLLQPISMEYWQGRLNRLHDRIQYSLQGDGTWRIERLAP
jgi:pyridoxamine 5'-phosphate oxidase